MMGAWSQSEGEQQPLVAKPGAAQPEAGSESPKPPSPRAVSVWNKCVYGLPYYACAAGGIPVTMYLPMYYLDTLKVAPGLFAVGFAAARLVDPLSGPLIGWLSDNHTHTSIGRRPRKSLSPSPRH
jgi:hypothetical protein